MKGSKPLFSISCAEMQERDRLSSWKATRGSGARVTGLYNLCQVLCMLGQQPVPVCLPGVPWDGAGRADEADQRLQGEGKRQAAGVW